jgi:hypothetical protein
MGYQSATPSPIVRSRDLPPASAHDRGALINDYSNTSHSNATPSGSFSNHFSAASTFAKYLDVVFVSDLLARVDVNENSHWSLVSFASAAPKPKLSDQVRQHGLTGRLSFGERLEG